MPSLKLQLNKETVRALVPTDLDQVAGGLLSSFAHTVITCGCSNYVSCIDPVLKPFPK